MKIVEKHCTKNAREGQNWQYKVVETEVASGLFFHIVTNIQHCMHTSTDSSRHMSSDVPEISGCFRSLNIIHLSQGDPSLCLDGEPLISLSHRNALDATSVALQMALFLLSLAILPKYLKY